MGTFFFIVMAISSRADVTRIGSPAEGHDPAFVSVQRTGGRAYRRSSVPAVERTGGRAHRWSSAPVVERTGGRAHRWSSAPVVERTG
ncbi:hypothetical protein, partial [Streptomyces sp. NPDC018833]|uniref:hypothetical protein n=1 Tax=Streptomyces sp. NPDC018833 TaxID=3365053 RepID=UPI00378F1B8B